MQIAMVLATTGTDNFIRFSSQLEGSGGILSSPFAGQRQILAKNGSFYLRTNVFPTPTQSLSVSQPQLDALARTFASENGIASYKLRRVRSLDYCNTRQREQNCNARLRTRVDANTTTVRLNNRSANGQSHAHTI